MAVERRAVHRARDGGLQHLIQRSAGDHGAHPRPRRDPGGFELARHPAAPAAAPAGAGADRQHRVVGGDLCDEHGVGVEPRVRRVQAVEVGEQDEQVGLHGVRHERRDPVVVAVAQLVAGDRVVLVDDRDAAELEQTLQRLAPVQVLVPIDEVVRVDEHLGTDQPVTGELVVVHLHEARLADRRDRLQRQRVGRPGGEPERGDTGGDRSRRDEQHLVAIAAQGGDLAGELHDRLAVDGPAGVGDRRRADLDDDPHVRTLPVTDPAGIRS